MSGDLDGNQIKVNGAIASSYSYCLKRCHHLLNNNLQIYKNVNTDDSTKIHFILVGFIKCLTKDCLLQMS